MKTKYLLPLIVLNISINSSMAQHTSDLDSKYGFKKFRFGTHLSQVQSIKEIFRGSNLKGVAHYQYLGTDITELRGAPIQLIVLSFFRNKLYRISVEFGSPIKEYSDLQYQAVQQTLESSFGNSYNIVNQLQGDMLLLNSSFWDGMKVRLEHTRVNLRPNSNDKYNHIVGYILYIEKNLDEQQKKSELDEL